VSSFGAVLDACVLIPAPLRDTLLRAVEGGFYRLHWSEEILEEVRRNLVGERMTTESDAQDLIDTMRLAFPEALTRGHQQLVPQMTNDPKDRHVLAVAVMTRSQVIVTANLRDFSEASLAPFGVEAQSPDAFLSSLFESDPRSLVMLIEDQAAALKDPPMTVDEVLDELVDHAPRFVQFIREYRARNGS